MNIDFETEFQSEEELEQAFDEMIESIRADIEDEEGRVTILNGLRLKQLQFTYSVLKFLTRGTDAEVSYKLYEPFKTMGSVSVEGRLLEFDNPEWFARAAEFASNTEVYPLNNNRVRLTFTFHGLTVDLGE